MQAALEKEKILESNVAEDSTKQEAVIDHTSEPIQSITSQMNELAVSGSSSIASPTADSVEGSSEPTGLSQDIDKKIRALKKKVHEQCFVSFCIRGDLSDIFLQHVSSSKASLSIHYFCANNMSDEITFS